MQGGSFGLERQVENGEGVTGRGRGTCKFGGVCKCMSCSPWKGLQRRKGETGRVPAASSLFL